MREMSYFAELYNVLGSTIIHDEKVAAAIDAIGEKSPEAKRMILSGYAKISKKKLIELADSPRDVIEDAAKALLDDLYEVR